MNELISIIIPIYNVENYLSETINSVCKQTYEHLEIILVDDGSIDRSPKICEEFAQIDNRIIVIHKKNGGLSSARNAGIEIATGNYIYFLDGDDFIEKNSLELLIDGFKYNSNIGIVSAPCFYSYNNGEKEIFNEEWIVNDKRIIEHDKFCLATLKQETCHSACSKLYKKELFQNIRFREGKKNEDTLFMFDLSNIIEKYKYNMLEISYKLYYYRVTPGSITRNIQSPIQIDIMENLQTLIFETRNHRILKTLKSLFYNELLAFYSTILLDRKIKEVINPEDFQRFDLIFKQTTIFDLLKYSSAKNAFKYLVFNYFPSIYIHIKSKV